MRGHAGVGIEILAPPADLAVLAPGRGGDLGDCVEIADEAREHDHRDIVGNIVEQIRKRLALGIVDRLRAAIVGDDMARAKLLQPQQPDERIGDRDLAAIDLRPHLLLELVVQLSSLGAELHRHRLIGGLRHVEHAGEVALVGELAELPLQLVLVDPAPDLVLVDRIGDRIAVAERDERPAEHRGIDRARLGEQVERRVRRRCPGQRQTPARGLAEVGRELAGRAERCLDPV